MGTALEGDRRKRVHLNSRRTADPSIAFELPSTLRAPETARRLIEPLKDPVGLPVFDDLILLLCEVITNSVRHAGLRSEDRIRVRLSYGRGWIHAEVLDPGSGFEPPSDTHVAPDRDDGYGLLLVSRLSTRWGAERIRDGMRVWFDLSGANASDASRSPHRVAG